LVYQFHTRVLEIIPDDAFCFRICVNRLLLRYWYVDSLTLISMEHIVISQHGDKGVLQLSGLTVLLLYRDLFPEHHELRFFSFPDMST